MLANALHSIGTINWDCRPAERLNRISQHQDFWCIDQSHCFAKVADLGLRALPDWAWVRIPGFWYPIPDPQELSLLPFVELNTDLKHISPDLSLNTLVATDRPPLSSKEPPKEQFVAPQRLSEFEQRALASDLSRSEVELLSVEFPGDPRVTFILGALAYKEEDLLGAKAAFHKASLLGHPDALEAEWNIQSLLARPFREKYPEVFERIERGDRLRALMLLRNVRDREPLHANAILAYCLRTANEPLEGLETCQATLKLDPHQSDVLGHMWAYLTQLRRDQEALETAKTRIREYPQDPQAYTDALDSALLVGDLAAAGRFAHQYLIHSVNTHTALKNLFKYYESIHDWTTLKQFFELITPLQRALTPETLVLYGEALIELHEHTAAEKILNRALAAAPQETDPILSYGRLLARRGDEREAIRFLQSVLADRNRRDDIPQQLLLRALLSELLRNTENLIEAVSVWDECPAFDADAAEKVGPRPFVEYGYCLAETGELEEALSIKNSLHELFPHEPVVNEFADRLNSLLD